MDALLKFDLAERSSVIDMRLTELSLDVGCGWRVRHNKRGVIGIDLRKGKCDVVADAENLPFQDRVFGEIFSFSILEHLNNPFKCLGEVVRVAKDTATIKIIIPIHPYVLRERLRRLVLEFPFSVPVVYKEMIRYCQEWSYHKNYIKPKNIAKVLRIMYMRKIGGGHAWFLGRKGKIVRKILDAPSDFMASDWYLECKKY